jgi:hypothetical protein
MLRQQVLEQLEHLIADSGELVFGHRLAEHREQLVLLLFVRVVREVLLEDFSFAANSGLSVASESMSASVRLTWRCSSTDSCSISFVCFDITCG